jgi:hypothetical protein
VRNAERLARPRAYRPGANRPPNDKHRKRLERLGQLDVAVRRHEARCIGLLAELDAASRYRSSTPSRLEGWPLELVMVLTFAAFAAQLFAVARIAEMVGFRAERTALAVIVAASLIATGVLVGEALRQRRVARASDPLPRYAIAAAGVGAIGLLAAAWAPHLARAGGGAVVRAAGLERTTLGILTVALVLVPVAAWYHREAWTIARVRHRLGSLQRRLRAQERLGERKRDERARLALRLKVFRPRPPAPGL